MKKQKINNLNLDLYEEILENGLLVYICPMKKNNIHASLATRYGSDILDFKPRFKDELITIPEGTAHFLEHKMFVTEDGSDSMVLYSNNGASSNAYTTSNVTRYYFTGASHFYENLKILLDCLTTALFTKENIEKEIGIITQEINSGLSDPGQRIYYLANKNLFVNHPRKYSVAGTEKSIKQLTKETLYDCFETFYNPSNMYLVITGNVNPDQTIKFVKEYFKNKPNKNKDKIEIKKYDEPEYVNKKQSTETMDVVGKYLTIAYKIKQNKESNRFKENMYLLIYLDSLFSEISQMYSDNHKDKNILNDLEYFTEEIDGYFLIYFFIEVENKTNILNKINKKLNEKKLSKEDFDLIVKNVLKAALLSTENIESMANLIVNYELVYGKFYPNFYEILKTLDYEEYKEFITNLDLSNYVKGIIENK